MIKLLKAFVILALLCAIAGGAFGAYYFLVERPRIQDESDVAAAGTAGVPTPDPTTGEFEKIRDLRRNQQYDEARAASEAFLTRFPDSSHRDEAETMLGELNVMRIMSGDGGPDAEEYVVQRGDLLDKVAHKTHSNQELIFQVNGMERTTLRIGQKLRIPQVDFSAEVHLKQKRILLLDRGRFFKSYPLQEARAVGRKFADIHTKVQEKLATRDGRRVAFGSKDYPGSLRSLTLTGQPGFTIYGEEYAEDSKPATTGLGLLPADAEELHTLLTIGSPVTISAN